MVKPARRETQRRLKILRLQVWHFLEDLLSGKPGGE